MKKNDRRFLLCDIILVAISLYLALMLRFNFKIPEEYTIFFKYSIIPVIIITIGFNIIFKLYRNMWKYASIEELVSIIYSVSISSVVFIIYSYLVNYMILKYQYSRFPSSVHAIFWLLCVVFLGGVRFVFRIVRDMKTNDVCDEKSVRLLIVGAGDAGDLMIREIKKHHQLNYNIVGIIDDDASKKGKTMKGIKVVGDRNDIVRVCEEENIQEIILAIPSADFATQKQILNICKKTKCKLKTVPGIFEIIDDKVSISKLRDVNIEDLLGREPVKLNNDNINKYVKNKIIFVTGGGGSIGSELCRQIARFEPKKLLIFDIYENNAYELQNELKHSFPKLDQEVIIGSVRDVERLRYIFGKHKPDVVFHAAAHKHVPMMEANPGEVIKNNIIGTYNLAKCCDEFGIARFVQISTDKAVNPTNIMGASKRFCEIIIQAFDKKSKTEFVAVRFGNVLGSNGSVIPLFKNQIAYGGPVTVMHPEINRFFMTIPEAAQLVIQAGGMANGGEIFVLDMGEPVKIADLARDLITLSGLKPDVDIKIDYVGLRPGEKLYEELLMDEIALTSTEHNKIFVEKPMESDMDFVEKSIEEFKEVVNKEPEEIFKLVEQKVPTYKRKKD